MTGVVLLALFGLFLTGRFPQEPLRKALESRLRQGLGPGSSVGQVRIVPGRLQLEVRDLVLVGPNYRLVVPRAFVVARLAFLRGTSLSFRIVQAERPHLTLRPATGTRPKQPLLKQPLLIEYLELTDGTVVYDGGPGVGEVELRGVDARGSIGNGTLEVALDGGTLRRGTPLELRTGHGLLRVSSELDVTIDALQLATARSQVKLSGRLGVLGMLEPDVQVDADVNLADAEGFVPEHDLAGAVSVKGRVKHGESLSADLAVSGRHLRLDGWPVERVQGNVKHGVDGADRTALDLEAVLLGGSAGTRLDLRGSRADGRVRFSGIDVAALRRQGIDIGFLDGGQISGTVTGGGDVDGTLALKAEFSGSGRGGGFALDARGTASGDVEVERRRVDLAWGATLEADPLRRTQGALRLLGATVTARGTAKGALPPAVDSTFAGHALLAGQAGQEQVPL